MCDATFIQFIEHAETMGNLPLIPESALVSARPGVAVVPGVVALDHPIEVGIDDLVGRENEADSRR